MLFLFNRTQLDRIFLAGKLYIEASETASEKGSMDSTISSISSDSINIVCPPLFPPTHGYLECTRPNIVDNITSTSADNTRISRTNRPGSVCELRCPTRYVNTCDIFINSFSVVSTIAIH